MDVRLAGLFKVSEKFSNGLFLRYCVFYAMKVKQAGGRFFCLPERMHTCRGTVLLSECVDHIQEIPAPSNSSAYFPFSIF